MGDFSASKINHESQLLLEQPLLRMPLEQLRSNFKSTQRHVEREKESVLSSLKTTANASLAGQSAENSVASLDAAISRMQGLKRKIQGLQEEEQKLFQQSRKRIQHLQDLHSIPDLGDVKYENWSKTRFNRILTDYLMRRGYQRSAVQFAKSTGIEDLVDLKPFAQCMKIVESLRKQSTPECLAWCSEHRSALKKANSDLEFKLRLQQMIELSRADQTLEARQHLQKYLMPQYSEHTQDVNKAIALLAIPPSIRCKRYEPIYATSRWDQLITLFTTSYYELFSLPPRPLLHIGLSAGLTVLKTPSCHSKYASSSANASSSSTCVCPICSTELNELARELPYAHHSKSYVEQDPYVLPNGRAYGLKRLVGPADPTKRGAAYEKWLVEQTKSMLEGEVKDPTTGEVFQGKDMKRVYIT